LNKRKQNEEKFKKWEQLQSGGRIYWCGVPGKSGWKARYLKEVDAYKVKVKFWQEIFDEQGSLAEIHEKYPFDRRHKKLK
jgi:hypothetical protein